MTRFYIEQKHESAEFFSTYSDVENIDNYGDNLCTQVPTAGFPKFLLS